MKCELELAQDAGAPTAHESGGAYGPWVVFQDACTREVSFVPRPLDHTRPSGAASGVISVEAHPDRCFAGATQKRCGHADGLFGPLLLDQGTSVALAVGFA